MASASVKGARVKAKQIEAAIEVVAWLDTQEGSIDDKRGADVTRRRLRRALASMTEETAEEQPIAATPLTSEPAPTPGTSPDEVERPLANASTEAWREYRLATGRTEEELEGLGRAALITLDQPGGNASTEAWAEYRVGQGYTEEEVADKSRAELMEMKNR